MLKKINLRINIQNNYYLKKFKQTTSFFFYTNKIFLIFKLFIAFLLGKINILTKAQNIKLTFDNRNSQTLLFKLYLYNTHI